MFTETLRECLREPRGSEVPVDAGQSASVILFSFCAPHHSFAASSRTRQRARRPSDSRRKKKKKKRGKKKRKKNEGKKNSISPLCGVAFSWLLHLSPAWRRRIAQFPYRGFFVGALESAVGGDDGSPRAVSFRQKEMSEMHIGTYVYISISSSPLSPL